MLMVKFVLILALLTLSTFCDTIENDIQGNIDGGATNFQETDSEASEKKWVYFDKPINFGMSKFSTTEERVFNFSNAIGKDTKARKAQVLFFVWSGNVAKKLSRIRTRVLDGKREKVHWTYIFGFEQNAVSYNSENFEIPIRHTR